MSQTRPNRLTFSAAVLARPISRFCCAASRLPPLFRAAVPVVGGVGTGGGGGDGMAPTTARHFGTAIGKGATVHHSGGAGGAGVAVAGIALANTKLAQLWLGQMLASKRAGQAVDALAGLSVDAFAAVAGLWGAVPFEVEPAVAFAAGAGGFGGVFG